ncbi:MAG: hypothetical protein ABII18_10285 [bacterium]|nr:hypothetical protein [bacterium]MBU1918110.1 hypothetical protein [bacterium]
MVQYTMLGELICYCSKCKLDLNHRITLMDGTRPKRVMCLTCKATHSFKDPDKPKTTKKNTTKGTAKALTKAKVSAQEKDWRLKLTDTAKTPSKYNMKEAYSMEELVYHPTFGRGIVVTFDHPDKIHVFFDEGLKVLKGLKKTA